MKAKKPNIFKEIFIMMILLILIMLIMAVALYDFIPSNISIPEPIQYASDSETTSIKQEISYTNGGDITADSDEELVTALKSYSIEANDLTAYGEKNLYNSGNSNPFDYASEETPASTTEGNTTSQGGTTSNSGNTNTTTQSGTTTNGTSGTTTNQASNAGQSTSTQTISTPTSGTTSGTFFESPASK